MILIKEEREYHLNILVEAKSLNKRRTNISEEVELYSTCYNYITIEMKNETKSSLVKRFLTYLDDKLKLSEEDSNDKSFLRKKKERNSIND
jgi:hypothetical protein